jgi:hypothetical protein
VASFVAVFIAVEIEEGGAMPRIVVMDRGSGVSDHDLAVAVAAMQRGIDERLAPAWNVRGTLVLETIVGGALPDDWTLTLFARPDDGDDLGHHVVTPSGMPAMVCFPGFCADQDVAWTTACFHEIVETLVDPKLRSWRQLPAPDLRILACEPCDPVQRVSFAIDDVQLCDFVTPAYYTGAPGPLDVANAITAMAQITPGGYVQQFQGGKWQRIQGDATAPLPPRHKWSRSERRRIKPRPSKATSKTTSKKPPRT